MEISKSHIDSGNSFDWGRTSVDYALYRDIYPEIFYQKIADRGLCIKGQKILDLGTGTGVLPRNMYHYGGEWLGTDISENQIEQAKILAEKSGMDIKFEAVSAENVNAPDNTYDVITACQCFWYFDHKIVMPELKRMLKPDGRLLLLYMAWLPFEDRIAEESEKLVLKYSPKWNGAGETRHPIWLPDEKSVFDNFEIVYHEEYDLKVPFTRESWNGRMKACRGVGASLSSEKVAQWEKEHKALLEQIAPESFEILHYAAIMELKPRKEII